VTTKDWTDHAFAVAIAFAAASLLFGLVCTVGCVTRTTVCVETSHALGPAEPGGYRHDSVGASVCQEFERP